jgi:hypothetical protein
LAASDPRPIAETNAASTIETWKIELPNRYVPSAMITSS